MMPPTSDLRITVWRTLAVLAVLALLASVASSLRVYPHSLAYFNEASGGPVRGHRHMLGSNFDWGQDLLYVRDWLRMAQLKGPVFYNTNSQGLLSPEDLGLPAGSEPEFVTAAVDTGIPIDEGVYVMSADLIYSDTTNMPSWAARRSRPAWAAVRSVSRRVSITPVTSVYVCGMQ